jgi:hypothetical protein
VPVLACSPRALKFCYLANVEITAQHLHEDPSIDWWATRGAQAATNAVESVARAYAGAEPPTCATNEAKKPRSQEAKKLA